MCCEIVTPQLSSPSLCVLFCVYFLFVPFPTKQNHTFSTALRSAWLLMRRVTTSRCPFWHTIYNGTNPFCKGILVVYGEVDSWHCEGMSLILFLFSSFCVFVSFSLFSLSLFSQREQEKQKEPCLLSWHQLLYWGEEWPLQDGPSHRQHKMA